MQVVGRIQFLATVGLISPFSLITISEGLSQLLKSSSFLIMWLSPSPKPAMENISYIILLIAGLFPVFVEFSSTHL